jgi:hypothetical protein
MPVMPTSYSPCPAHRYHSRLHNVEFEAWVVPDQLPDFAQDDPDNHTNVYFWRHGFNPYTLQLVDLSHVP